MSCQDEVIHKDKWGKRLCKCGKAQPHFNEPNESTPICCSKCKTDTMIDVKHPKCKCGKGHPIYNEPSENKPICCKKCKTATMINVVSPKCKCGKAQPKFNEPGEKTAICCNECKTETMINIKCEKCKCGKAQPTYNEPGEKKARYCSQCKTETMVNITSIKCKCGKAIPSFNEPGEIKAICCVQCKTETMINIVNSKCKCGKATPYFNERGETKAICCFQCKTETMINVLDKICKTPLCETRIQKKYQGYCFRCFINIFPDHELVRNHKTKERAVADYIRENFSEYTITLDKRIDYGCSAKKPDIYIDFGEYVLIVEIDENQHKSDQYSCENKRMMILFQDAGLRPLVMIRFNPDQYYDKDGKSIASCWGYTEERGLCHVKPNKKKEWEERLQVLRNTVKEKIEYNGERKNVDLIHLFYDENL